MTKKTFRVNLCHDYDEDTDEMYEYFHVTITTWYAKDLIKEVGDISYLNDKPLLKSLLMAIRKGVKDE